MALYAFPIDGIRGGFQGFRRTHLVSFSARIFQTNGTSRGTHRQQKRLYCPSCKDFSPHASHRPPDMSMLPHFSFRNMVLLILALCCSGPCGDQLGRSAVQDTQSVVCTVKRRCLGEPVVVPVRNISQGRVRRASAVRQSCTSCQKLLNSDSVNLRSWPLKAGRCFVERPLASPKVFDKHDLRISISKDNRYRFFFAPGCH